MSTLAFSSIGSKLYLSAGVPATFDATGYAALSYTEVKEITDLGMIGPESSVVLHQPVSENTSYKLKTGRNNGSMDCKMARAPTDPGQALLVAAENSTSPYALKVVLQNGTILYSQVLVMSYKTSIGNQGQITGAESKLEISGAIVTV